MLQWGWAALEARVNTNAKWTEEGPADSQTTGEGIDLLMAYSTPPEFKVKQLPAWSILLLQTALKNIEVKMLSLWRYHWNFREAIDQKQSASLLSTF